MPGYTKQRTNWQDYPVTSTPVTAAILNAWETTLYELKTRDKIDPKDYGAVGDGSADDTTALAGWAADLSPGVTGFVPPGQYKHDGTLVLPSSVTDITIVFATGAWLAPTAGWALKSTTTNERLTIFNLGIRINSGSTMTRGLWLAALANWANLYNPQIWAFATPPANFVGIDVEGASLWVEIHSPRIRKNSGGVTGTFAKGIRFAGASNAGRVIGGSINHCDRGVSVEAANSTRISADFEDCTDGVHVPSTAAASDTCLTTVAFCRSEGNTNLVNLAKSATHPNYPELYIGGNTIINGVELANPNSLDVEGFNSPGTSTKRIWMPASEFITRTGSPVLAAVSGSLGYCCWAMDSATTEVVIGSGLLPADWRTGNLVFKLYWTNLGAGSGNVVWRITYRVVGDGANMAGTLTNADSTITAPAQDVLDIATHSAAPAGSGDMYQLLVQRLGGDGADTLGNDAGLVGVLIEYVGAYHL